MYKVGNVALTNAELLGARSQFCLKTVEAALRSIAIDSFFDDDFTLG